jgi:5'-phosphate synthase pdxT subunit
VAGELIGVLGLQGDYHAHGRKLEEAGARVQVVKKTEQLRRVQSLVIPGGESTALIKLMEAGDWWASLRNFAGAGKPMLGTCAGMILLAGEVLNPPQKSLGLIDATVERNSYGRQQDSFEDMGTFGVGRRERPLPMVFIRAPRIRRLGPQVKALAFCRGDCVLARQGPILVASFHPELTADLTVHRYFLDMVA